MIKSQDYLEKSGNVSVDKKDLSCLFKEKNEKNKDLELILKCGDKLMFEFNPFIDFSLKLEMNGEFSIISDYSQGLLILSKDGIIRKFYRGGKTILNENNPVTHYRFL